MSFLRSAKAAQSGASVNGNSSTAGARSVSVLREFLKTSERRKQPEARVEIVAFTLDDRFFSSLLYVTTQYGWTVQWAKSLDRALEILKGRTISILIYDCYSDPADWPCGVARFTRVCGRTSIVLAAPQVDEDVWERALGYGVYDVVCRTGHAAQLASTLRFASEWNAGRMIQPGSAPKREPGSI